MKVLRNIFFLILLIAIFIPFLSIEKSLFQINNTAAREIKTVDFSISSFVDLVAKKSDLKGESEGRINILILGIVDRGFESPDLTDTILIASINILDNKAHFISLPRDLYVKAGPSYYSKINALYQIEQNNLLGEQMSNGANKTTKQQNNTLTANLIKQKIYEITELKIHYTVVININSLKNLIDALGGINVWVEKDLYDPKFPTPGYGTEIFEVKSGWRYFDGETAIKYVRTRNDPEGDFGRIKRQQMVLLAIKRKIASLNIFWDAPKILSMLNALSGGLKTDLEIAEIKKLWDLTKNIDVENISGTLIDAQNLLKEESILTKSGEMFILTPKAGWENYEDIKNYIQLRLEIN